LGLSNIFPQKIKTHRSKFWQVLFVFSLPIYILTITGFLGQISWAFEITSHFRVQYFFILIIFTIFFFLGKQKKLAFYSAVFALTNLILIWPYWFTNKTPYTNKPGVKALLINLDVTNFSHEKVSSLIGQNHSDIIILEEFDKKWKSRLGKTLEKFPYSVVSPWNNGWAIGLFSRLPLNKSKLGRLGKSPIPYVMAEFEWQEKSYTLLGAHLQDPMTEVQTDVRNRQLASLADIIKNLKKPIILLGDLNISLWSPYFQLFIKKTDLREARLGWGLYPTWPTNFFPLRIPIDHGLVSKGVGVHSFSLGPNIGSDHFPIIIQFS